MPPSSRAAHVGVLSARAPLYARFSGLLLLVAAAAGLLGGRAALGGRLVALAVLLRRWLRCWLLQLPSSRCRGAAGGLPLEPSMEGMHRRFLELYVPQKEALQKEGEGEGEDSSQGLRTELGQRLPTADAKSSEAAVLAMQKIVVLPDGQQLAYWDVGPTADGENCDVLEGGAVLLINGLGARVVGWAPLLDALHAASPVWKRRRLIVPEYRGQFASSPLAENGGHISVQQSAADAAALAKALGLRRCSLLCWSTGVQVGLQLALERPELVEAMVLIQGTTGQALDCLLQPPCRLPGVPRLLAAGLRAAPALL
ncbi:unnamed protein product, partial [Polarella glacialis]